MTQNEFVIDDDNRKMFETFAYLHPVEAYDLNKEEFYRYIKKTHPILKRKHIDELIEETRQEMKIIN